MLNSVVSVSESEDVTDVDGEWDTSSVIDRVSVFVLERVMLSVSVKVDSFVSDAVCDGVRLSDGLDTSDKESVPVGVSEDERVSVSVMETSSVMLSDGLRDGVELFCPENDSVVVAVVVMVSVSLALGIAEKDSLSDSVRVCEGSSVRLGVSDGVSVAERDKVSSSEKD